MLSPVLLFAFLILFLTVAEYRPKNIESVKIIKNDESKKLDELNRKDRPIFPLQKEISILSWNIGYACLGDNADFFMDGGKSVFTASKERLNENIHSIANEIKNLSPHVIFLQEIDLPSTRSKGVNEVNFFQKEFPFHESSFCNNYKCVFVPFPFPPLGKIDSGIMTLSLFEGSKAERVQLPIPFKWPVRIANLKRCLLINRFPIKNSQKEIVLINLHLEAYDEGSGKKKQAELLTSILFEEMQKGNYVVAGGDFNQIFSTIEVSKFKTYPGKWQAPKFEVQEFTDAFYFLMDSLTPSCRSLDRPHEGLSKNDFQYYVIDGFIVSKNIKVKEFSCIDFDFKNTDHNPVLLKIELL